MRAGSGPEAAHAFEKDMSCIPADRPTVGETDPV